MTDLYIKQHVFTIGERFTVYSEDGSEKYYVSGEFLSLPKTFHITSADGEEVAEISRRLFSWTDKSFDFIIVDEAHHITADSYQKIVNAFPNAYL